MIQLNRVVIGKQHGIKQIDHRNGIESPEPSTYMVAE